MTLTDRIVASAYTVGWAVVRFVPEKVAAFVFRQIADVMWRRRGKSVRRLESNLARVTGGGEASLRALSKQGLRSYMRYWMEIFRLPAMDPKQIHARTHSHGEHHIFDTVASGRGVVIALPHMGNWDAAGIWLVQSGHPFTTVMERLKPETLFEKFVAFRTAIGMEVLPLTAKGGGTAHAFGTLAQRTRAGGVVCLPADRDLTESGVEVDFFGARTRMAAGPALLALQTGAALLPVIIYFDGDDWGLDVHPEVPVPDEGTRQEKAAALTQGMAAAFEKGIAEHPDDWHMLQRLWLDDLEPREPRP
ncbi:phosphatidylinositol mannoside acyltransferase [Herbidospora galbida]|uniref:Phosphatidylinositol mannoside acyltransferase n=1 Tax=Herbidospora galbida TaxID=2575442 RepID=A0A4U3LRU0_9ACTN|nr:phosphatidylinositol mannoside acyltransferase [Herbidospora galbida]TKK78678.1 phosphatidylinositol mannoside acyltransferase [Herbidospora galbida]